MGIAGSGAKRGGATRRRSSTVVGLETAETRGDPAARVGAIPVAAWSMVRRDATSVENARAAGKFALLDAGLKAQNSDNA